MTDNNFHKLALSESFERVAKVAKERDAFNEAMEHVIHSSMPIDFERRYAMDNLIAQDADLIDLVGRLHEQADRQYGSIGSLRSVEWEAADCIEEMDRHLTMSGKVNKALSERIEALEAENERLRDALQSVVSACDQGKLIPLGGPCGMTIDAQIRGSVYNRVPAWPVEEARTALDALGFEIREKNDDN